MIRSDNERCDEDCLLTNGGVGMKSLNKLLLIMFMFCAVSRIAYADDAEIRDLRNRIEYLEKKVESMDQTLTRMMAILNASPSVSRSQQSVTPDPLKWRDKQNWRRLRTGMSKDEVRDLLGEPDRIDNFGAFESWNYGNPVGGEVQFSPKEKLNSWHEPPSSQ
jgi:hypothetical protein